MLPFQRKEKIIEWEQIENIQVRNYILYPGKTFTTGSFEVYTIFDEYGLYIFLKNGRKLIIGTKKPDEVRKILKQFHSNI